MPREQFTSKSGNLVQIDEDQVLNHLGEMVRGTVEETLNAMLEAEADLLCNAKRYERTEGRKDTHAGHYQWTLYTKAGEVNLKMPKFRTLLFETAIIERYQRSGSSVEEALIEMYLAESLGDFFRKPCGSGAWCPQTV